jgi:hypothetical protein
MNRDEIKQTIDDFLTLVENGCDSIEENEAQLKLLLDKLALAQHFSLFKFDEKNYANAPVQDHTVLRKSVESRFPNYGYYNIAEDISKNIGETKVNVGDAIDDIADIAQDLREVAWCWTHNSQKDGLWHFRNNFKFHWGEHLRGLQLYLQNFEQSI